jgi:hypothetical protein
VDGGSTAPTQRLSPELDAFERRLGEMRTQNSAACTPGDLCCETWARIEASHGLLGGGRVPAC